MDKHGSVNVTDTDEDKLPNDGHEVKDEEHERLINDVEGEHDLETKTEPNTENPMVPAIPVFIALSQELIAQGLCAYEPSIDGLQIAPSKFICNKKLLTDISDLERFHFIRYINVAFNDLTNVSALYGLQNLIVLNASYNRITEFPAGNWPCLTHLLLDHNELKELRPMYLPRLKLLSLNFNQLRKLADDNTGEPFLTARTLPELHTLELAHNKLYLLEGAPIDEVTAPVSLKLYLPKLKALFLNHNELTSLATYKLSPKPMPTETLDEMVVESEEAEKSVALDEAEPELVLMLDEDGSALGELPELSVLNLRSNGLRDLEGLGSGAIPALQYLNLRENLITNIEELEKLKSLPRLQTLILADNPLTDVKNYRIEVKTNLHTLDRLDKEPYTAIESEQADMLAQKRQVQRMTVGAS